MKKKKSEKRHWPLPVTTKEQEKNPAITAPRKQKKLEFSLPISKHD